MQVGDVVIVTDPVDNRLKADILLKTEWDSKKQVFPPVELEISGPGEYEAKEIEILGIPLEAKGGVIHSVYAVRTDDLRLAFFGNADKISDPASLSKLGPIDIAFVPATLAKQVKILEPKIIIPSFAKNAKSAAESFGGKSEVQEKLVIKAKDLPQATKIIILKN